MEGEGFRDRTPEFDRRGVDLYGISYDTPEENRAWAEKMGFAFPLLCDPDRRLGAVLEVERDPGDRYYGLPRRVTFVIDPELTIRKVYEVGREDIASHPDQVLADLDLLLDR